MALMSAMIAIVAFYIILGNLKVLQLPGYCWALQIPLLPHALHDGYGSYLLLLLLIFSHFLSYTIISLIL
jgi:hypothetical protein